MYWATICKLASVVGRGLGALDARVGGHAKLTAWKERADLLALGAYAANMDSGFISLSSIKDSVMEEKLIGSLKHLNIAPSKVDAPLVIPRVAAHQMRTLYASYSHTLCNAVYTPSVYSAAQRYRQIGSTQTVGKSTSFLNRPSTEWFSRELPIYGKYLDTTLFNAGDFEPWKTPVKSDLVVRVFEPVEHAFNYQVGVAQTVAPTFTDVSYAFYPTILHFRQGNYFYPAQLVVFGRYTNSYSKEDVFLGTVVMQRDGTYDDIDFRRTLNASAWNVFHYGIGSGRDAIRKEIVAAGRRIVAMLMAKFEYGPSICDPDNYDVPAPPEVKAPSPILSPYTLKSVDHEDE